MEAHDKMSHRTETAENVKGIHNKYLLGMLGYLVCTVQSIVECTTLKSHNKKNK